MFNVELSTNSEKKEQIYLNQWAYLEHLTSQWKKNTIEAKAYTIYSTEWIIQKDLLEEDSSVKSLRRWMHSTADVV